MKRFFSVFIACFFSVMVQAQTPKREFRGAWIATVNNIDYPSSKSLTSAQQQAEFIKILDQHQQAGINAVMVQIRTNGDAFYPSELAPWSEYLTSKQGKAPEPFYDPMAFMVAECRKRGIEFHAWFNPYRAVPNINTTVLDAKHVAVKHPEWLLPYGNLRVLDPGKPEVIKHITEVVMEVATKYDIDGVHFDDYFYPYPSTGLTINDSATYNRNSRGILNRADWRRDNVNILVKTIADTLKAVKPWVKFGISPFGIWQNKTTAQPLGSATSGLQSYSDVYCDSRLWLQKGWVDYIAPQIYWNIGLAVADFSILVPWWANNVFDRHLYIGHAAYRINATDVVAWQNPSQMPTQIRLARSTAKVQGSIFYNTNTLNKNLLGFRDSLITKLYKTPALMPQMLWKDAVSPDSPKNLTANLTDKGLQIKWQKPIVGVSEMEKIRGYVLYRFADSETVDITNSAAIRGIIYKDTTAFSDTDIAQQAIRYTYVLTAFDRLHNESLASNMASVAMVTGIEDNEVFTEAKLNQNAPNPFDDYTKITYKLERASHVSLKIFDIMGTERSRLVDEYKSAGEYSYDFHNLNLETGVYFYSLQTQGGITVKRMIVIR
ncbi:family 10 glycosylhydrolase [Emticicia aquatilis]|nr:family 10 glycosylhydrolase [Emticicia aquatilis]